ncbi:MAG TPA: SMC family ATPase, partial [Bacillales bacterium]|nr:SMC family ATPase [Bacillales bacterium]
IRSVLPEREEAPLFGVLAQEHYNVHQIIEALGTEISHYVQETEQNKKKQSEASKAFQEKTAVYHRAQTINDKFQVLDNKKKKKAEMDAEVPQMQEKQQALERAEKASHLEVYEKHVQEAKQEETKKKQAFQTAATAEKETSKTLLSAQNVYEKEEANGEKREQVSRETERLKSFLPTVRGLDDKKNTLAKRSVSITEDMNQLDNLKKMLEINEERKTTLHKEIRQLEQELTDYLKKMEQLNQLREKVAPLKEYLTLESSLPPLEKAADEKQRIYQMAKKAYDQLESHWREGQATLLAAHLHDGMPCPVCGSTEHPNKAAAQQHLPAKEELERLKKERDLKQEGYMKEKSELDYRRKQLEEKEKDIRDLGFQGDDLKEQYDRLVKEGRHLRQQTEKLKKHQAAVEKRKEEYEQLEKEVKAQTEQYRVLEKTVQEKQSDYKTEKALYDQAVQQIPEGLRFLGQLQKRLNETEQMKQQLEKQWKDAQEHYQKAKEEAARAQADRVNADKQQEEAVRRSARAERQFEEELQKAGFADEADYRQAKMAEPDRISLKKAIDTFFTEQSNLAAQILQLNQELEGQSPVDMDLLLKELTQLEQEVDAARTALQLSETCKKEAEKLSDHISRAADRVTEAERNLRLITDLYDVVRGDNGKKISFERYLQIEFLEQIIDAANERLKRLSNGQFYLMRSDRLEKRGRQSGLGLDVYDVYTGQTRDVKSLSGGEKFNASLCLALGMADVIQAFEGGISIDTMLIDEGFGALDEESLNKAIDTLIDLQRSGRMVGVISHVQELKAAIPAVLDVQKTKEGHSRTRFLLR